MSNLPILSIILLLPLFSALYIVVFVGHSQYKERDDHAIYLTILSALFTFIATIFLLLKFDSTTTEYQFVERYNWLQAIGLDFQLGVDGISIFFICLTSLLVLICMIISFFTIKQQIKEFLLCFLLFESFCIGAFCSMNLLLFYFFFEVILIPMYLIIGIWGGENRIQAAFKFFIYTFFGSILFLAAIIYIYINAHTFDIVALSNIIPNWSQSKQNILWLAIFIAFAVKVPMFPFHTWLPQAHVQAPTAGSVILAGILLKLGAYGFIRILLPIFPDATVVYAPYMLVLSAIAVVYASLVAFSQTDMKSMIAYSSIAHMGYVTGGIFSLTIEGLQGAIFQMISHGIISSALFIIVGILHERGHTKDISHYGGVASRMPMLAVLFTLTMLGSIGMPGSSGFVGEFFSLVGVFKVNNVAAVVMALGIILGATYMLTLYKKIMLGKSSENILAFEDLSIAEITTLAPLTIMIAYFGIFSLSILNTVTPAIEKILMIYAD